ncbi:fimbria/pilus periplasmic chaperone [Photobacterium sp. 53610]|uniref:fimbria/pilus periplasmic chaperone n=1 Tax=Photobacterium sp. 53610 TaxID=3102789 RepID=UPI002EDA51B8
MKWIFIALLFGSVAGVCHALEVGPLVHEIQSDSPMRSSKVTVRNNSANTQLVDAQVMALNFDKSGFVAAPVNGDEIIVTPPAFKLEPGQIQSFMVVWAGGQSLKQSRSYSVQLSALSQKTGAQQNNISILINYNVIVHVSSTKHVANISTQPIHVSKSDNLVNFTVDNLGTKYTKLSNYNLRFKKNQSSKPYVLTGEQIAGSDYDVFIPAKQATEIHLPNILFSGRQFEQVTLEKRLP